MKVGDKVRVLDVEQVGEVIDHKGRKVNGHEYEIDYIFSDGDFLLDARISVRPSKVELVATKEDFDNHYKKQVEPIELIEAFDLNFNLGNCIKYIARCNHKGNKQDDLRKALYYLNREFNGVD
jgi:hypothetical protein